MGNYPFATDHPSCLKQLNPHTRIVPSFDDDMICLPSGKKATTCVSYELYDSFMS